jgi:putative Mn2+ efflux pump MntP
MLGIGLAMDAFSVSLANGLNEPCMKFRKMSIVAAVFAIFQGIMPLIGWFCVHSIATYFKMVEPFIPWIALALLCWIGGHMIHEGVENPEGECGNSVGVKALLVQGIATSIDALSVGFTIASYDYLNALCSCAIIAAVTYVICFCGICIGKKAGTKLAGKAGIFGGVILILIGIEIVVTNLI